MFQRSEYSKLSKVLHHLALSNQIIPEFLLDLEYFLFKKKIVKNQNKKHVFVCGLPRSGTTILMKSLYETDKFASLTYRDMPFILCPNLWKNISKRIKKKELKKRIHADDIEIDIDSPEALEEVFWKNKIYKEYTSSKKIFYHDVDNFTISEFQKFVSLVLLKYEKNLYLSKNNNNIFRLQSIFKAFPQSIIIVPFRNPLNHASSLLKLHKLFLKIQKKDSFITTYMRYLGHHEFGETILEYEFSDNLNKFDKMTLDYWLNLWIETYKFLKQDKFRANKNLIYIDYDYFCDNPKKVLNYIYRKVDLNISAEKNLLKQNRNIYSIKDFKNELKIKSFDVYNQLKDISMRNFT